MSEQSGTDRSREDRWEEHNENFRYEPPEKPAHAWSSEEFEELHDRVIRKHVQWVCGECEKACRSLDRARRHVQKQHGQHLVQKHATEPEETVTDGGKPEDDTPDYRQRQQENHGLGDFGGQDDE